MCGRVAARLLRPGDVWLVVSSALEMCGRVAAGALRLRRSCIAVAAKS